MQYRKLGETDFEIPALILGTATFGGGNEFYKKWGETDVREATELVDIALDYGCTLFDTADAYSMGLSEEILGGAIKGRRDKLMIASKTGLRMGPDAGDVGTSHERIIRACEASLTRLGTDCIDLYQLHAFDTLTPVEEMLKAIEQLLQAGKIRAFGVSNYSGWHLMKMLALADQHGLPRPIAHQVYYSLLDREIEWELMPLGLDQHVSTLVWSPLASAQLTGKVGRHKTPPAHSRVTQDTRMAGNPELLYGVTDALEQIAEETNHSVPQVALAWLLARPTVAGIVIGARHGEQLKDNLRATHVRLNAEQTERLDRASARKPVYPYWHQQAVYAERNPGAVTFYPPLI